MAIPQKSLKVLYGTTVFVSSAMLLVLEIVAGRLLAPYVGVSLYTWTSIIGVILAGLSLGNWIGGSLADRGFGHRAVAVMLLVTAIASAGILPLLASIAAHLQSVPLNLATATVAYVAALFFIPAVLIGAVTPLVTTLYLSIDSRVGSVVGRMHALAALGSIIGTFLAGFVLIQWLGTRNIVLVVALVLFLLSLPFWLSGPRQGRSVVSATVLFLAGIAISVYSVGRDSPCTVESNYYCLRVVDETTPTGSTYARTLVLDHMVHSTNVRDDATIVVTPYVQAMEALIDHHYSDRSALRYYFAGGGAYTHPRLINATYPEATVTVSEIDPAVTGLAASSLYVNTSGMTIYHQDSRRALESSVGERRFDVIVTDVFHDVSIPYHLATHEYARLARSRLSDEGLYLVNVIDVFPEHKLVQSMTKTLAEVFEHVGVWVAPPDKNNTRQTYVISGSNTPLPVDRLLSSNTEGAEWFQIKDFVEQQLDKHNTPLLTDDFAPVERLLGPLTAGRAGI